ncbi:Hypothetical protein, putative [Bodo saltans]|uniref:Uncharacterized protein n=1 Tax=Bodo saltans TaxID=75058 RepID=A0A0S4IWM8_BODSA|nr:Hypothetical protein, putative [Bodo saltans]|eukprot:CUG31032.1 Hypothetical protein, putative [Bodo saltans]
MIPTAVRRAPIFCRIIDSVRLDEPYAPQGTVFPIRIDLGDGVESLSVHALQDILDKQFARSSRYGTVKNGFVYDKTKAVVTEVRAYGKYIVTGSLRGGYIKGDTRFGPRLTGYNGATTKPGLKWNGDDL